MSSLLMQAAQSAAQADGLAPSGNLPAPPNSASPHQGSTNGKQLRRGKWTAEEEAYANRLIQEFKAGLLPLADGTTLRTFLSKLLNCDPMRISKKFVGSNCIGKQVFRRKQVSDLNKLTPEQISQSRAEICELERRFLERVAQTSRGKSSGGAIDGPTTASLNSQASSFSHPGLINNQNPAWMQPPFSYDQGTGGHVFAASNQNGANSRAAAAGRALLGDLNRKSSNYHSDNSNNSANILAMAELQRRASQQSMLQNAFSQNSAGNLLSAMQSRGNTDLSNAALAQITQNVSSSHLSGMGTNSSMNDLMMKTGLSRDQITQLARNQGLSSGSLSNMVQRQSSFDALMSLDMQQSFQSIDNLANLFQTQQQSMPEGGMQNANFDFSSPGSFARPSEMSNAARRLASSGQMSSLLNSISSNNFGSPPETSNANLSHFLQQQGPSSNDIASLLRGQNQNTASLANLFRNEPGAGLSTLARQDGHRNPSVDNFLSMMTAGEISRDPQIFNVSLMQQQHNTAQFLAQQAQNNPALANALAARQATTHESMSRGQSAPKRKIDEVSGAIDSRASNKK